MNKFHYNKFGIIQIGVKVLSQTQNPKYIQIALSHKNKTKEPKVHKY